MEILFSETKLLSNSYLNLLPGVPVCKLCRLFAVFNFLKLFDVICLGVEDFLGYCTFSLFMIESKVFYLDFFDNGY